MLTITTHPTTPRAAWLKSRQLDVTASEVSAIYGKHKQCTRLQLAYNKLYGEPDKVRDRGVLRRGQILEPACAAAVELDHGIRLTKVPHYIRGRDLDDPRIKTGATLDYEHEGDGTAFLNALDKAKIPHALDDLDGLPIRVNFECKSIDRDIFESEWCDGPPVQHIYQALWQSSLGGYDFACVASTRLLRPRDSLPG